MQLYGTGAVWQWSRLSNRRHSRLPNGLLPRGFFLHGRLAVAMQVQAQSRANHGQLVALNRPADGLVDRPADGLAARKFFLHTLAQFLMLCKPYRLIASALATAGPVGCSPRGSPRYLGRTLPRCRWPRHQVKWTDAGGPNLGARRPCSPMPLFSVILWSY